MKGLLITIPDFVFWASHCGPLGHIGVSANWPTMHWFDNLSTFSYTKSKLIGSLFYEQNCQLMYLRPHFAVHLPIRLEWTDFFLHKIKIRRGPILLKKLLTHVFGFLQWGPFWTNGSVGQSAQIWLILTFKNICMYKIKIQRGYILWKKLPSHVIRAPCGRPFWSNAWLPTGQIWADQIFLNNFKLKIQNKFGSLFMQKLAKSVSPVSPRPFAKFFYKIF